MKDIDMGPVQNPDGSPTEMTVAMLGDPGDDTDGLDPRFVATPDGAVSIGGQPFGRVAPDPLCDCGHPIAAHQTGEGPWTGFCGATDCECEEPTADEPRCAWCGDDADPEYSDGDGLSCAGCASAECTVGGHTLADDAVFIVSQDGDDVACKACLYGLADAKLREDLIDDAAVRKGHGCIDEAVRTAHGWGCALCGLMLEQSGDALVIPLD